MCEIISTLQSLKDSGVSFILLRNHSFLASKQSPVPDEVDILVPHKDREKAIRFFTGQLYLMQTAPGHMGFRKAFRRGLPAFDIQTGWVRENNIPVLSYEDALGSSTEQKGFLCLSGTGFLFHLVMHCMICKGAFKQEYQETITELIAHETHRAGLISSLKRFYSNRRCSTVVNALQTKNFTVLSSHIQVFTLRILIKNPGLFFYAAQYIQYKLCSRLPMRGIVVSLIGLDGTGKTTLAFSVKNRLLKTGIRSFYLYMGRKRGHALPMHAVSQKVGLSQLKKKKRKPGILFKMARDCAYILDMWARYLFFIFPKTFKNTIVFADRYAYDVYLDSNMTFVARLLLRFFYPRPAILIFIETPEDEIIRRKDEYSKEKRQQLLLRWQEVIRTYHADRMVTGDLEEMADQVCHKIFSLNTHWAIWKK